MKAIARRLLLLALITPALMPAIGRAQDVPEPEGYRTENYRAPTPATLSGARVLTTKDAHQIWTEGRAVFLDVLPRAPRPPNLPPGTIWRDKQRLSIPGSVWLPDTGYGALAPVMEDHLRSNLRRISAGGVAKLFVVYCQRACWMSWNAAKRILTMGHTNVAWYPDGTDGWQEANLPLQESIPILLPEQ
jgi:PQQ-dependent catabolism-associated CXXCW motif protein